ncbi:hypothetical protein ACFV7Q_38680, partial [Streptomyces sp. NPDC059851]
KQGAGARKARKGPHGGKADEGVPVESTTRSGEDLARGGQKGHHDLGSRGRSQRPSGGKDTSAFTGVEKEEDSKRLRPG